VSGTENLDYEIKMNDFYLDLDLWLAMKIFLTRVLIFHAYVVGEVPDDEYFS